MIAYVICLNDNIQGVSLTDEESSLRKLKVLSDKHYKQYKKVYKDKEEYDHFCYWHLHEVNIY